MMCSMGITRMVSPTTVRGERRPDSLRRQLIYNTLILVLGDYSRCKYITSSCDEFHLCASVALGHTIAGPVWHQSMALKKPFV